MRASLLLGLSITFHAITVSLAQQPTSPTAKPQPAQSSTQQQQQKDEDVVRITTNLVQVDAVVTDKSGAAVTDLKPEEIQIFEDGKPQKVTHFSYILAAGPAETANPTKPANQKGVSIDKVAPAIPPTALRPEQVRRTIAIVVDDLGLSFQSVHFVKRALKNFVDEQMQPTDLVAIVRTAGGNGALQQFTSDKRLLYAAIEHIRWYASGRGGVTPSEPIEDIDVGPDATTDFETANDDLNQFREDVFSVGTLGEVGYVVKGLRELPGRKSILLISDGFRIHSRSDTTREYQAMERLRQLIDQASRASVVIYTMNAAGLETLGLTARDYPTGFNPSTPLNQMQQQLTNRRNAAFERQEGLDYLADETGGISIRNTNDLSGGIRRVMEDQRGYYLIGYRPNESTFDQKTGRRTFHKLSLKVTRPGKFEVRMRNGFFGVTDEEARATPRTPQEQVVEALTSPFHTNGVHLQLSSFFANNPQEGSFLRSVLHIDANDLTFTNEPDGSHRATFNVIAFTFGADGRVVDQTGQTYTIRIPAATYERTLKDGLIYSLTVPIKKPGAYQLRAALRDEKSERVGSASQFVSVPDFKKSQLALSGLVVTGMTEQAYQDKIARRRAGFALSTQQPAEGEEDQTDPEASPAVRHFRQGLVMQFGYVIYNAQLDKATGQPRLQTQLRLYRDGKLIFKGKELPFSLNNPPDLKRLNVSGAIHLGADMASGEYVFQVVVTDLLSDQKHRIATQWIDFEVVK
jgi:VWFA-related protein